MKLLVRATNWLGDAVMSIPALRAIRESFPDSQITVLARPWVADLYAREEFCDRIIRYDRMGTHGGWGGRWRLAGELRGDQYDCAILLQNAFDAALLACLARIPRRIGYARDGRGFLLTDAITHGPAGRTNQGHRRITLYRYSPKLLRSRFHYVPSKELLADMDEGQRGIIQPIPPRFAPAAGVVEPAGNHGRL